MTESTVDESLAKALGWKGNGIEGEPTHWCAPVTQQGCTGELPRWSESFDACLRDIVPVLRARGLTFAIYDHGNEFKVEMGLAGEVKARGSGTNVSLPAAFCEAALAALVARESPEQAGLIFP